MYVCVTFIEIVTYITTKLKPLLAKEDFVRYNEALTRAIQRFEH